MNDDNITIILIWKCLTAFLIVLTLTIGGCVGAQSYFVVRLVEAGADPLIAQCAMSVTSTNAAVCTTASFTR